MKTITVFLLCLITGTVFSQQKRDSVKLSPEGVAVIANFEAQQKQLQEQFQQLNVAKDFYLSGYLQGTKKAIEADSVVFVAPDKWILYKKKALKK